MYICAYIFCFFSAVVFISEANVVKDVAGVVFCMCGAGSVKCLFVTLCQRAGATR